MYICMYIYVYMCVCVCVCSCARSYRRWTPRSFRRIYISLT